jgi:hypothetical protein
MLAQFQPSASKRLRHAHPSAELIRKMGEELADKRYLSAAVEGGGATLLSIDDRRMAVWLRAHVEFELLEKKMWLLPAQYEGHLIWGRVRYVLISFHLRLPPRDINWDINYGRSADIGYLPMMEVAIAGAMPVGAKGDVDRQLTARAIQSVAAAIRCLK